MLIVMPLWLWLLYAPIHLALRLTVWILALTVRAAIWIVPRIASHIQRRSA